MNRYPGAPPFQDTAEDTALFFGRDDDIDALYRRLLSCRFMVLYGVSGLGKTSLLKAGVFGKLRERGFLPLHLLPRQPSIAGVFADIAEAAGASPGITFVPGERASLWEFFKTAMFWRGDTLLNPVLVFDQFEEVFTLRSREFRLDLAREIGSLVSAHEPDAVRQRRRAGESGLSATPPEVKVLLSLREEYLGALQELASEIPGLLQERFRLLSLSSRSAVDAITKPAALTTLPDGTPAVFASPTFSYEPQALDAMLRFLEDESGSVEPWQLQLLCQHVEQQVIGRAGGSATPIAVGASMLGGDRGMKSVLGQFYLRTIAKLSRPARRRARVLCEEGLLTMEGHRRPLSESDILKEHGVDPPTLDLLVNERLLRREKRIGSVFYELSHDSLVTPILESRPWRLPKKVRQSLWVGVPSLAIVLLVVTIWVVQLEQAKQDTQRERDRAEELVGFLLGEDWLEKLRAIGRTEILVDVQRKVDDYLDTMPAESRHRAPALKNRGLVHRTRGELLVSQGSLAKAHEALRRSEEELRKLHELEPQNPEWRKELAITLSKRAGVERDRAMLSESVNSARAAVVLLQRVLEEKPEDARAKHELASAYEQLALSLEDQGHSDEALKILDGVVALTEEMMLKGSSDPILRYHLQAALDGRARILLGRRHPGDQAKAVRDYDRSLKLAQQLTKLDPLNAKYKVRLAIAIDRIGNLRITGDAQKINAALKSYLEIHQTFAELVERDPRNLAWARDAAVTAGLVGEAYLAKGDKEKALRHAMKASEEMNKLAAHDPSNVSWQSDSAVRLRQLGLVLRAGGDQDGALKVMQRALSTTRQLSARHADNLDYQWRHYIDAVYVGDVLAGRTEGEAALAHYAEAEAIVNRLAQGHPENGSYRRELANIAQRMARLPEQRKDADNALSRYEKGLASAREAVRLAPEDQNARVMLSRMLYEVAVRKSAQSTDEAWPEMRDSLAAAEAALRLEPNDYLGHNRADLAWFQFGKLYERRGEDERALKAYLSALDHGKRARSSRPGDTALTNNLRSRYVDVGNTHVKIGDRLLKERQHEASFKTYKLAESAMNGAAQLEPDKASGQRRIAQVRLKLGDLSKQGSDRESALTWYRSALAASEKAVALEPEDPLAHNLVFLSFERMGGFYRDQKEFGKAVEAIRQSLPAIQRAIQIRADEPVYWDNLYIARRSEADALQSAGKGGAEIIEGRRAAIAAIRKAVELVPSNLSYRRQLGVAHWRLGRKLDEMGELSESLLEYNRATEALNNAIAAAKGTANDPLLWRDLSYMLSWSGRLHQRKGEREGALQAYRESVTAMHKAVDLDPKSTDLRVLLVEALRDVVVLLDDESSQSRRQRMAAIDRALSELRALNQEGKLDRQSEALIRELETAKRRSSDSK